MEVQLHFFGHVVPNVLEQSLIAYLLMEPTGYLPVELAQIIAVFFAIFCRTMLGFNKFVFRFQFFNGVFGHFVKMVPKSAGRIVFWV